MEWGRLLCQKYQNSEWVGLWCIILLMRFASVGDVVLLNGSILLSPIAFKTFSSVIIIFFEFLGIGLTLQGTS